MRLTSNALQRVLDFIDGDVDYLVVDAGTPIATGAVNEVFRESSVATLRDGNTTLLETYIDELQVINTIGGFVLMSNATATPGSGVVFAYEPTIDAKAFGESLTISVEITVEEVVI